MLYRGRGSLDTITQAEIIAPHRAIHDDLPLFAAGKTMLEAVDRVAEEHERNVRVVLLLLSGLRSLEARPMDPAAVAESFLLKLLSVSGFHPSLTACAVCGSTDVQLFSAGLAAPSAPPTPSPAPATSPRRRSRSSRRWRSRTSRSSQTTAPESRTRKERVASCSASPNTTWSGG